MSRITVSLMLSFRLFLENLVYLVIFKLGLSISKYPQNYYTSSFIIIVPLEIDSIINST